MCVSSCSFSGFFRGLAVSSGCSLIALQLPSRSSPVDAQQPQRDPTWNTAALSLGNSTACLLI